MTFETQDFLYRSRKFGMLLAKLIPMYHIVCYCERYLFWLASWFVIWSSGSQRVIHGTQDLLEICKNKTIFIILRCFCPFFFFFNSVDIYGTKAMVGKTAVASAWIKAVLLNYAHHCYLYHHGSTGKKKPFYVMSLMKQ